MSVRFKRAQTESTVFNCCYFYKIRTTVVIADTVLNRLQFVFVQLAVVPPSVTVTTRHAISLGSSRLRKTVRQSSQTQRVYFTTIVNHRLPLDSLLGRVLERTQERSGAYGDGDGPLYSDRRRRTSSRNAAGARTLRHAFRESEIFVFVFTHKIMMIITISNVYVRSQSDFRFGRTTVFMSTACATKTVL